MKRTDITAGTEYGAASSNDWKLAGSKSYRSPRRVRVLDVGNWANGSYYARTSGAKPVTLADGSRVITAAFKDKSRGGVLVQPMNTDGTPDGNPIAMAAREIRAPWAEVLAIMEAVDAAAQARADRATAAQKKANDIHAMALSHLAALDPHLAEEFPRPRREGYGEGRYVYILDMDVLAAILTAKGGQS